MQCNTLVCRMEVKTIHEISHDKLSRLIELHLLHHLTHTVQTWTLSAEHRILAFLRCLPQGCLQFGTLTVCDIEHTLRLPNLSAAHLLHSLWEDYLIASLCHQLDNLIHKGMFHISIFRLSHSLVDTTWEIHNF